MNETSTNKPPIWFWIVSVIALIWNGLGVDGYLGQAYNTERYRNAFTAEELEIAASAPAWVTAMFAIAVFAGAIAAIGLLLRKKWATTFWAISLIAVIIQMSFAFISNQVINLWMAIMIVIFAFIFLWFSRKSQAKGWIS
ncbi:hypothetical protein [Flavivirga eckloniae]|uniref:Sugar transporter n=1 Tax=Flavivirga eckloniae TaxID=1803846 RepID=A0A2K9PJS3_9FLAO|nr:hypothetical protein [Flavivirga eckloniae]AUP77311.1 hypothetical protein C1H87_00685 [Flavivirga eckloniae]